MPKIQGIYIINNVLTGEGYIGGSSDINSRWSAHKCALRKCKHQNSLLQQAWNQYGQDAFSLKILELVVERFDLTEREQFYLDGLQPIYNSRHTAIRVPVRTVWTDPKDADRFWNKVEQQPDNCWLWNGSLDACGYGRVKIMGKTYRAHRLAYLLTHGSLSDTAFICHRYDNPRCVNPAHLFEGTAQDNIRDRKSKGRCASGDRNGARRHPERMSRGDRHWTKLHPTYMKGENHIKARLSNADVTCIRELYGQGGVTQKQLGKKYGVAQTTISALLRRETWNY